MEVHRQTCQNCQSRELHNILKREPGESDKVYVQCARCGEMVSRYIIAQGGYYHHGKGFESYLRGLNRGGAYESAKEILGDFGKIQNVCLAEFEEIKKKVEEKGEEG